jgi:ubiquinone/menaquinone biosynthesis C-methylase UbiE
VDIPNLFAGTVDYYLQYRSHYPERLIDRVAQLCQLGADAAVLDLGCGPGLLARAFAPHCSRVVGVDPAPGMLAAAQRYIHPYEDKARFVCASAHELSPGFGSFHLAVIGRAFHWMDRAATLRTLASMIEPGGAVVLFRAPSLNLAQNAWRAEFDRIFAEFASSDAARQGAEKNPYAQDEEALLASPFNCLERISTVEIRKLTPEHLIGRAFSMAGTSPQDLGEKLPLFVDAMRRALSGFTRDGVLSEITEPQALIARRAF